MAILPAKQPLDVISMQLAVMEKATKLSGINTNRVYFIAYANMGFLAGLAGLLTVARMTSAQPTYGQNYEMDAIGSCFIGGASAYGGTGTVPGVIVGAVLMGIINQGMSIMGTDQNMQKVVKGAVLLAAVIFDVVSQEKVLYCEIRAEKQVSQALVVKIIFSRDAEQDIVFGQYPCFAFLKKCVIL